MDWGRKATWNLNSLQRDLRTGGWAPPRELLESRVPSARLYRRLGRGGAPIGLLAVRFLQEPRFRTVPTWRRVLRELSSDPGGYLYVAASTSVAFVLFGYLLGRQADSLTRQSHTDPLTGLYKHSVACDGVGGGGRRGARHGRDHRGFGDADASGRHRDLPGEAMWREHGRRTGGAAV